MITVLIAARDREMELAHALSALVPAATEGIVREVVLVDGGSTDGTMVVADAAGCTIVDAGGDSSVALRAAVEAARAEWLLFLSPLSILENGWQDEALAFIDSVTVAGRGRTSAACFSLGRMEPGWRGPLKEWSAALRSRLFAAPHEAQGLLVSRSLYRAVGGHRSMPAMADVDLARRIGARRLTVLRSRAVVRGESERGGLFNALRRLAVVALLVLRVPTGVIRRIAA
jgi:glycosyltransferase involved in cell wall biosynthesis